MTTKDKLYITNFPIVLLLSPELSKTKDYHDGTQRGIFNGFMTDFVNIQMQFLTSGENSIHYF